MDNILFASANELAKAIHDRQVSATEVVEAHLSQIDKYNPRLNVIVTLDADRARKRAQEADAALRRGEVWGPLHGVPITIKDGFATAGIRTTSGFPPWADFVPQFDATVVARLRAAGAIILGKTNLPTLSMGAQANNPIFGRTNNPWDLTRTTGGSTGGAAAVAAGLSPLELGSDLAGSVRIPAHFCGVFSLKPSDYRIPTDGYHPNPNLEPGQPGTGGPAEMAVFGPLARSVDDLALMFKVIAGPIPGRWEMPPVPVKPMPARRLERLRLVWTDDFGGVPVSEDTKITLANLAAELARNGCRIEPWDARSFDFAACWELWGELCTVFLGFPPDLETYKDAAAPMMRGQANGLKLTLPEYQVSLCKRSGLINVLEMLFQKWDALICPVVTVPAFPHCAPDITPILVDQKPLDYGIATISYTSPFNVTGHPVVVVPVGRSREGLPIGVQVVGRRWGEMPLLATAKCISQVLGPFQRPPGY